MSMREELAEKYYDDDAESMEGIAYTHGIMVAMFGVILRESGYPRDKIHDICTTYIESVLSAGIEDEPSPPVSADAIYADDSVEILLTWRGMQVFEDFHKRHDIETSYRKITDDRIVLPISGVIKIFGQYQDNPKELFIYISTAAKVND